MFLGLGLREYYIKCVSGLHAANDNDRYETNCCQCNARSNVLNEHVIQVLETFSIFGLDMPSIRRDDNEENGRDAQHDEVYVELK